MGQVPQLLRTVHTHLKGQTPLTEKGYRGICMSHVICTLQQITQAPRLGTRPCLGRSSKSNNHCAQRRPVSHPPRHMFSKYPDACRVMCIIRLPALHLFGSTPWVAGPSAGVSPVPVAPPMRTWQSQRPAEPRLSASLFHSTRIAPAVRPRVVKRRSCSSMLPTPPGFPTLIRTLGFLGR
jgi:hypothetical protein